MSDLQFLAPASPRPLAAVATASGTTIPQGVDPELSFCRVAALDRAGARDVTVFEDSADLDDLRATRAGACFVSGWAASHVPAHTVALVAEHPKTALRQVIGLLYGDGLKPKLPAGVGLDISARIDAESRIEQGAMIESFVVIGPRVEIGSGTIIGAHSLIGAEVQIGRGCTIESHVTIRNALIGDRVTIQAGARIGAAAPGFGRIGAAVGRVIIQDGVEIGANATIERGLLHDTVIGEGSTIAPLTAIASETTLDRGSKAAGGAFSLSSEMV